MPEWGERGVRWAPGDVVKIIFHGSGHCLHGSVLTKATLWLLSLLLHFACQIKNLLNYADDQETFGLPSPSLTPLFSHVHSSLAWRGVFMFCRIDLGFSLYVMLVIESRHRKHLTRCPFSLNFPYKHKCQRELRGKE